MKIAIAGLGLIGGSIVKAARARTSHRLAGYDISPLAIRRALEAGVLDESGEDIFSDADLVLVALFPGDAVDFIRRTLPALRPGATVIDLCGVKRSVCAAVAPLFEGSGVHFIGGHPMAGRECVGFENAAADLFHGASMILTPPPGVPEAVVAAAGEFFLSLGFGHIEITTPERHDAMIAYTSQMAHVVSSAYVQNPESRDYRGFSAGSFKDLTRVAKLNEEMWTELFLRNSDYLTEHLDILLDRLSSFRDAIRDGEADRLRDMLRQGRELKEAIEA